jgi:DNA-binding transcriptional MocR family regulator
MNDLKQIYENYKSKNLTLNMQRGQPSDENFALSDPMLKIVDRTNTVTPSGIEIRNYPGGPAGLPEAREFFGKILGTDPENTIVGNNASLRLLVNTLMWALIKGLVNSSQPWSQYNKPKAIVAVPGYDRHFTLLDTLGFEILTVKMTRNGPDIDEIEELVMSDDSVKCLIFIPTYSNPTGDTISDENVKRLAEMQTKATDFTIFADDAYAVHHLTEDKKRPLNIIKACRDSGNENRAYILGSTSKITFSGAGLGYIGSSKNNINYIKGLLGTQSIGPNKIEQYRHVLFLNSYKGGINGLMKDHAEILKPKFKAVQDVLKKELGNTGLADWSNPKGGYFVSLNTKYPVAKRVVELAEEAGLALTPAGATFPYKNDPDNTNIRISPTRPPLKEVELAMEILAVCIKLASEEYNDRK